MQGGNAPLVPSAAFRGGGRTFCRLSRASGCSLPVRRSGCCAYPSDATSSLHPVIEGMQDVMQLFKSNQARPFRGLLKVLARSPRRREWTARDRLRRGKTDGGKSDTDSSSTYVGHPVLCLRLVTAHREVHDVGPTTWRAFPWFFT